jgi:hypothetical protein
MADEEQPIEAIGLIGLDDVLVKNAPGSGGFNLNRGTLLAEPG